METLVQDGLHVGVVGAGAWSRAAHVPGFQSCPGVELVAICDVDLERAERVATEAGIPRVYDSTAAMLGAERLDVVSIVTPDDCHRAGAELAITAGAHVLCEKPLATTIEDARFLAALAETRAVRTRVGFTLRYAPAMLRLRELVEEGAIGTPQLLQAFQQNGQFLDPATPFHWKMDRVRTGGGAIVEYGIHTFDIARWIMGEIVSVCASSRTWIPRRLLPEEPALATVDVDDGTAWLMEFASGAMGVCHAGWATAGRPPGLEVRVYGSGGAVRCILSDDLPNMEGLWLAGMDGHFQEAGIPARSSALIAEVGPWWLRWTSGLIRDFVADIETGVSTGPSFDDGVFAQEALAAVVLAVAERRWVDLPG
jgi:predicted dehydrogenase